MNTEQEDNAEPAAITWPHTIKLSHPIQFGTESIDSLTFRRGKLGDIRGVRVDGIPPTDQLITIASRMCGQPNKVIESLDADDAGAVIELVLGFFGQCLEATKTPSRS